ncbi:hypothetical protein N9W12_08225 [Luminiphilus sp.]|nr:hypothetical protein [Luminiphilus sp.]
MIKLKTKTEKKEAVKTASWLDEDLKYHDPATLRASAETLLEALYEASGVKRKARDKHLPQLEIVLLGLLKASQTEYQCMAVQLAAGCFSDLNHLSYRVTVKLILNPLTDLGLLIKHNGYFGGVTGSVSRFQLTDSMLKFLEDSTLNPKLIYSSRPKTLVKIKPPKTEPHEELFLTTEEEAEVLRLEDDLAAYNARLKDTFLDLCVSEEEEAQINRRMARKVKSTNEYRPSRLWLDKKYIYRVFNNNSLEQGGRHYGGWWQTVPSEWRPRIVIDEEPTVEIDYGQLHFRMLYRFEGSVRATTTSDLYQIDGIDPKHRDDNKSVYAAVLNTQSRNKMERLIVKNKRDGIWYTDGFPAGIHSATDLLKILEAQHPQIEKYFYSGIGLSLQNTDSKIMHKVIMKLLIEHDVVALPIHDSVIVQGKYKNLLKDIMEEVYVEVMGVKPTLKESNSMEDKHLSLMDFNEGFQARSKAFKGGSTGY